jgi:hypothetical protein
MWAKRVAQTLALLGVYSLVLAAIGKQVATQGRVSFKGSLIEFLAVTVVFVLVAMFVFTRPSRASLE